MLKLLRPVGLLCKIEKLMFTDYVLLFTQCTPCHVCCVAARVEPGAYTEHLAARLNVVNGNYRSESGCYPANYIMLW